MKIAIWGYGNLGRGVERALAQNPDMETVGVFTRRAPETVKTLTGIPVYSATELAGFQQKIDVLIICGGSATDLPEFTPNLARYYNVVDSFDTHAGIPTHFEKTDAAAKESGHVALISAGWDPGLFSIARVLGDAILPDGETYTFWGPGVSQGHSDAIRRIPGVKDARQYTLPIEGAKELLRRGERPENKAYKLHRRECFVVAEEGADKAEIETAIKTMPNYFADYETTVHFIGEEELLREHGGLPHGGSVIRTGITGEGRTERAELTLALDSNPEFTGAVLVACARAVGRMAARGDKGCKTVLDLAPADLSPLSPEELRSRFL